MAITITHEFHVPTGKNHYTGTHQHGFNQWKLVVSTDSEKVIFFRTSLSPQEHFTIAGNLQNSPSFIDLIRNYSNSNRYIRQIHPNHFAFNTPVFSDDEIAQAHLIWTSIRS